MQEAFAQNEKAGNDSTELTAVQKFARYFEFREGKNWVYIPVPNVAYSPETSLSFGMANQILYRKRGDTTSTASSVNCSGYYTIKKQYVVLIDWNGYFVDDDLILRTYMEHRDFPLDYYGIGNDTKNDPVAIYQGKSIYLLGEASFRLSDKLWMGSVIDFSSFFSNKFSDVEDHAVFDLLGSNGFYNTGVGTLLRFDTRDHRLYSRTGMYLGLTGSFHPEFLGSTTNNFSMTIDYRHFFSPRKGKQTIGWQARISNQFGEVPFQILSSLGGGKWMRGYYTGRYRDQHSAFLQMEYRYPIWEKIGFYGATFMGVGDVFSNPGDVVLQDLKASIGAGVRYMLDKKTRTTVRFDYARSREGDNGFYIEVLEAF